MAAQLVAVGRRVVVWMVAIAAGVESAAQTTVAITQRDPVSTAIWAFAAVLISIAAANIERVKVFLGE